MGSGNPSTAFKNSVVKRQDASARSTASTLGTETSQSRLPQVEQLLQTKRSPEYEQAMERIRNMNTTQNTGSTF